MSLVNAILKVISLTTGEKFISEIYATWLYPSATSLARYVPSHLILNTHLHAMSLLSLGHLFFLFLPDSFFFHAVNFLSDCSSPLYVLSFGE